MKTITWDEHSYRIDGKPEFLISGEFHYFRVPKSDWRRRLELFAEAGGNCVATYIPWLIHEPVEGDIRFGDIPERDLEDFLQLCGELGIFVAARPGPYQYSELRYDGLPGWLCENYPEIRAQDVHGTAFRASSSSYLHPVFLEKAKKWFDTVCPIIARYTLSKGGPVAFAQIDNEMMGIHVWFTGGWDYNRVAMGIGKESGRYPVYLENRYKTVEHLNAVYDTGFTRFTEVMPFSGGEPKTLGERRRVKDYQDFYFASIAEYSEILTNWMRKSGIDCDIIHNSPNPASNANFLETVARLGKSFLLGSDHYYNLSQDWEQNNPTPQYASKVFYSNEMLRLMGFPPTVFELPGGSCSDWPPITPEDLKCCYLSNIALGMKGLNYYIFTGGPNPAGSGAFGDIYDYGAGIGADGSIRPVYEIQKEFGSCLRENDWLASAERVCDFNIGLDWEHSRSHSYCKNRGGLEFSNIDAWEFLRKGIMMSALCGSYAPNLIDLYSDNLLNCIDKPLVIPASVVMPEAVQRRLVSFVKMGGRLALMPVIPYMDENFHPCTILQDFVGSEAIIKCTESSPRVNVGPVKNILMNGTIFYSETVPGQAAATALEEYSGKTIGWLKQFEREGRVMWLGFQWNHSMHEHSRMVKYLLDALGCSRPVVECDNPNIWTSLRLFEEKSMLFVMNLYSSPMKAGVRVLKADGSYTEKVTFALAPMEVALQAI
jgi:beta-galactosidase